MTPTMHKHNHHLAAPPLLASTWPPLLRIATRALAPAMALALAGCTTFSPDGGFGEVARLSRDATGQAATLQRTEADAAAARASVADLLAQPLTADSAVAVALLNNPGLQARYAALGIAEADFVRASRPANPAFSIGRLQGGGAVEIDRAVLFDVLGLLALPQARQAGARQFAQAQLQAAADTVALASDARQAYFDAVAAQQLAGYFGQVQEAADAAGDLARRMAEAGNLSALAQWRELAFQADATAQLARARHQVLATRERLWRLLGGPATLFLPDRLPDLPDAAPDLPDTGAPALDRRLDVRLDVRLARLEADAAALALDRMRANPFIDVLQAGVQTQGHTGEPRRSGATVELDIPLFDFGATRMARAEALHRQAQAQAAQVAIDARSDLREALAAYRTAHDLARHQRDVVLPLRRRISDETLLRYNGMLASPFELLADAREQITAVTVAVQALHDHWAAHTRLQAALAGAPASQGTMR